MRVVSCTNTLSVTVMVTGSAAGAEVQVAVASRMPTSRDSLRPRIFFSWWFCLDLAQSGVQVDSSSLGLRWASRQVAGRCSGGKRDAYISPGRVCEIRQTCFSCGNGAQTTYDNGASLDDVHGLIVTIAYCPFFTDCHHKCTSPLACLGLRSKWISH